MPRLRPEPVSGATRLEDGMSDFDEKPVTYRTRIVGGVSVPYLTDEDAERLRRMMAPPEPDMVLDCEHGAALTDPCAACGRATLDAAWAEAQSIARAKRREVVSLVLDPVAWWARADYGPGDPWNDETPGLVEAAGPTPTAALLALVAILESS